RGAVAQGTTASARFYGLGVPRLSLAGSTARGGGSDQRRRPAAPRGARLVHAIRRAAAAFSRTLSAAHLRATRDAPRTGAASARPPSRSRRHRSHARWYRPTFSVD